MARWALLLEYDGSGFFGWQEQAEGFSVQAVLNDAATRLEGRKITSTAAGRTDSGVHATAQVAHIDLERNILPEKLADALNFHMKPHQVAVLRAAVVAADWSARFTATSRTYKYVILNRRARPALHTNRAWHVPRPLDDAAMRQAGNHLLGTHDFTSFRASACQASSPVRTLDRLEITRHADQIEIIAEARSFLHHQIRNIVGSLKLVGEAAWTPERMRDALAARTRAAAGPTAPAHGLFFAGVRYPADPFEASK